MKKVLSLIAIAAMTTLVACGPSAEEKAAAEKAKQDSIVAAEAAIAEAEAEAQATADSIAAVEAAAAAAQATADSLAAAEAAAKSNKPAPKKTMDQKVKEEVKKANAGRG